MVKGSKLALTMEIETEGSNHLYLDLDPSTIPCKLRTAHGQYQSPRALNHSSQKWVEQLLGRGPEIIAHHPFPIYSTIERGGWPVILARLPHSQLNFM